MPDSALQHQRAAMDHSALEFLRHVGHYIGALVDMQVRERLAGIEKRLAKLEADMLKHHTVEEKQDAVLPQ